MSDTTKKDLPDIQLDESTLHTFKKIVDSFPEDKRKMFSDSFNAVEDPQYKAEIIHNVILDAHPEFHQVPQVNQDMAQGAAMGGPVGLGMGMMKGSIPQDVPSIVGKLTSAMTGGVPQNVTRHPLMSVMGGQPAAIMASAAGQQGTGQNFGGDPKTMSGQISGDALAALAPALMTGGGKNLPEVRGAMVENPESQITRNLDKTVTEVLQPGKTDIQSYTDRGMRLPAVEQAGKVISKSKNYGELRNNINSVIESKMKERNSLLESNNQDINYDYLNPLKELIAAEKATGQAKPADIRIMEGVLASEKKHLGIPEIQQPDPNGFVIKAGSESKQVNPELVKSGTYGKDSKLARAFLKDPNHPLSDTSVEDPTKMAVSPRLNKSGYSKEAAIVYPKETNNTNPNDIYGPVKTESALPEKINILEAQKRKELMQDLAEKLLEKRADGEKVITQPARHKALDAIRQGLKQSIEKAVPEVKSLNETYDGLREARWLASGQKALADKEIPQSLLQKIAGYFDTNPAGVAIKVATKENRKLGKITSKIEGLQEALKNVRKSK